MNILVNPIFQDVSKTSLKLSSQEQKWEESLLFRAESFKIGEFHPKSTNTKRQSDDEIRKKQNCGSIYDNFEDENISDFVQRLATAPSTAV